MHSSQPPHTQGRELTAPGSSRPARQWALQRLWCLCLKCLSQDSHNLGPGRPVPLPSELGWVLLSDEISSDLFPATLKMTERDRTAEPTIPATGPAPGTFPLLIMPWG